MCATILKTIFLILYFSYKIEGFSELSFMASLDWNGIQYCGGTVISAEWVLTAAHCLYHMPASEIKVRIGSKYSNKGGMFVDVSETRIYDDPYVKSYFDDVGLIKLSRPVEVEYIKLPEVGDYPKNASLIKVYGYGKINEGNDYNSELLMIEIPVVTIEECRRSYGEQYVTDNMFCAYAEEKDACQGDAGGPAIIDNIQYGIISWGLGCARYTFPGVYTLISNSWIRSWIYRITGA
ncbi:trypsin-7-like [Condylostylus longicornis]|uniref:trypsin-7-like n=1 Tax=Condylostylus longicornis TaxID=2530218 RepID=UPI00244D9BAF|nr:trypsin-7-like [Condylostylus longicornis]